MNYFNKQGHMSTSGIQSELGSSYKRALSALDERVQMSIFTLFDESLQKTCEITKL
jgi:hypothetical protein